MFRKKRNKGKTSHNSLPKGVLVSKGFQVGKGFAYQPRAASGDKDINNHDGAKAYQHSSSKDGVGDKTSTQSADNLVSPKFNINTQNFFSILDEVYNDDDEVENIYYESVNLNIHVQGASTPSLPVFNV